MHITLAEPQKTQRPETDYERWISQKDRSFKPEDRPQYHPPFQNHLRNKGEGDKSLPSYQSQTMSNNHIIQPSNSRGSVAHHRFDSTRHIMIPWPVHALYFLLLVSMVTVAVIAFTPRRRRRAEHVPLLVEHKSGIFEREEKAEIDMDTPYIVTLETK